MTRADDAWRTRSWEELRSEARTRAERGAYPLFGIGGEDARAALAMIDSLDPDQWGSAWMAVAARYRARAEDAERRARLEEARSDYLKAWRLYTVGRWPVASSARKRESRACADAAFAAYGRLADPAIATVRIPFGAGTIVGLLQLPPPTEIRPPVLISIGGSDLWKDTVAIQSRIFAAAGIAVLAVDMPGAGDAPLPARPGAERMYTAVIDHVRADPRLDGSRIVLRGQSWGSYWAARAGYAEATRLAGVVFQSGPVHHYFQPDWQREAFKTTEFLFDYVASRLHMLGATTVEEAFALMPSLSLADAGLLSQPSPPMLLIAGGKDTQVPFTDFLLLLQNGSPKHAWVNPQGGTMGRSLTLKDDDITAGVILPWVKQRLDV
ncbi:MAG: alpha/beta hydrolase [Hyphomicrobiales bacterium]|nr:alpha/beta hydrolase [Hyphomicrobiales bacterium]